MDHLKIIFGFFLRALALLVIVQLATTATVGDGNKSLYTGKPIDKTDTRGACVVDGEIYNSETAIPKDHPCHYCICYQSQVTCYWKACAAPPTDCDVMKFQNVCNPSLYVCEIPEKTRREPTFRMGRGSTNPRLKKKLIRRRRIFSSPRSEFAQETNRAKRSLVRKPFEEGFPVEFDTAWDAYLQGAHPRRSKRAIGSPGQGQANHLLYDTSCTIFGVTYYLGEVIGVASDVCMECRCAAGVMFCSPKCCFLPSPFTLDFSGGHSLFIKSDTIGGQRPRHPLHYVRNQYTKGTFLR